MNNDVEFGTGIGVGIVSTITLVLMFLFGFVVGEQSGITRGEEKTTLITVVDQQQRVTFQHTYNKNLECRQALKGEIIKRVNEICGPVPQIKDFVGGN